MQSCKLRTQTFELTAVKERKKKKEVIVVLPDSYSEKIKHVICI